MERVKEFSVKLLENGKFPIVEINGEKINGITKLIVKYDSDDAQNNPLDNGFLVEYISEEGGRYYMQTIGQSFRIGLQVIKVEYDYSAISDIYKDDAFYYAKMVVDEQIKSSKKVFRACLRHLNDLKKIDGDNFKFIYLPEKAADPINFIEILPDVKTGKPYPLAMFQKFIIGNLYGWRKKTDHSLRRFRKAMISVARKNGKTILIAGILLYEFLFGHNPSMSRQLFCTANDRTQAKIAWDMAKKQLSSLRAKDADVRKATKIVRDELKNLHDESYIRALSRDTGAVDGFEPYVGVLDEFAASKTNEMLELLESGQGQLDNPFILIISTAGMDLNVPMHTIEYPYITKILDGEITDEGYFGYVAEQDNEEEIKDESNWIKSNQSLRLKLYMIS